MINNRGPRMLPCGTLENTGRRLDCTPHELDMADKVGGKCKVQSNGKSKAC